MLAGEPPVTGPNAQAMIAKLMTERPTRLRVVRGSVPEAIDAAVARALDKTPADRFRQRRRFRPRAGCQADRAHRRDPVDALAATPRPRRRRVGLGPSWLRRAGRVHRHRTPGHRGPLVRPARPDPAHLQRLRCTPRRSAPTASSSPTSPTTAAAPAAPTRWTCRTWAAPPPTGSSTGRYRGLRARVEPRPAQPDLRGDRPGSVGILSPLRAGRPARAI